MDKDTLGMVCLCLRTVILPLAAESWPVLKASGRGLVTVNVSYFPKIL